MLGLALDIFALAVAGVALAAAFAGAFAIYLIVSERRRHEHAEDELQAQASFFESLLGSLAAVSASHEPADVLDRTCAEAERLFGAREVRFLGSNGSRPQAAEAFPGGMRVPLAVRGKPLGVFELRRAEPFDRGDEIGAAVLADFAARAFENAKLLDEARERERERERLTESLITAEQDERRRLSLFLHDGPVQSMSGIALMHDAALAAIRDGREDEAAQLIESSLTRERATIRSLRDLSFAIEPLVLRDQGFVAAVNALAEQIERSQGITVTADVAAGERFGEKAQVAVYQLIREALNQGIRRRPGRIDVTVRECDDDAYETLIDDDGVGERRRGGIEDLEERVQVLNGRVTLESDPEGGTRVRVVLPAYAAIPAG